LFPFHGKNRSAKILATKAEREPRGQVNERRSRRWLSADWRKVFHKEGRTERAERRPPTERAPPSLPSMFSQQPGGRRQAALHVERSARQHRLSVSAPRCSLDAGFCIPQTFLPLPPRSVREIPACPDRPVLLYISGKNFKLVLVRPKTPVCPTSELSRVNESTPLMLISV